MKKEKLKPCIAKIFKNGRSQAIRLPKEFRFQGDHVLIKKVGKAVILVSPDNHWEHLFNSLEKFSDDFNPRGDE